MGRTGRSGGKGRNVASALLIAVVTFAAYAHSFAGVLVFDDEPAIAANPHIRRLWPLTGSLSAPPDTTASGRPVVSFSLALNYALAPAETRDVFGAPSDTPAAMAQALQRNLWGYHLFNLVVHVLAALALFGVVRRTLLTARLRDRFGGAATPLALGIALLWAVHPLQTGAVTYVIQRAESLMGLFYLLTLYCAIRAGSEGDRSLFDVRRSSFGVRRARYDVHRSPRRTTHVERRTPNGERSTPNDEPRTTSHWWAAGAVAVCALGMATKESMATAPLTVVAWDYVFGDERAWSRRWRLYLGLAATWLMLAALVAGGHRAHAVGFGFAGWPWQTYLLTQAGVIVHYLRLAFVPWPLVLDYDWPGAQSIAGTAPQVAAVAALLALTGWALARRSPAGLAGAWFFAILAPTSSVIPVVTEIAAEHRMYLPSAAVVSVVVLSAYALMNGGRLRAKGASASPAEAIGICATVLAIGALAVLTDARNRDYASYESIWLDTIQKRPANARARTNYASALLLRGEHVEAERHLRVAVDAKPDLAEAQAGLGAALCARGAFDEGIPRLQRAIAIQPDYVAAHRDLGEAFAASGQLPAAARAFGNALTLRPDDVFLLNRAGWILATARDDAVRDGPQAVTFAERAARLTGRRDVDSLDTLAAAYAEAGRLDAAVAAGAEALMLARQHPDRASVLDLEQRLENYRAGRKVRQ